MSTLKEQFRRFLVENARLSAEIGMYDVAFMRSVERNGPVLASKILVDRSYAGPAFMQLWELGRLELSVEAVVVERAEFFPLLDDATRERAAKRLREHGYTPRVLA